MPTVVVETHINAPLEVVFDLARDIELHCRTASHTGERAVAGVTKGLIGLNESVTFEAWHLGLRHRLTARVTELVRPTRFVDEMTKGPFQWLKHVHEFSDNAGGTLMRDTIIWKSPLGVLGSVADALFLQRHMRNFLLQRNAELKKVAEAGS